MQLETMGMHFHQNKVATGKDFTVEKEWGTEIVICHKPYACKIMTLFPDKQVSLHWHVEKSETFILIEGHLTIELIDKSGKQITICLTKPYSSISIEKNIPHTFYCPDGQEENTVFIESSTTDSSDDSYRIFPSGPKGKYSINR